MSGPERMPFVGVGVVVVRRDRWLLMRRRTTHGEGTWSTPGGHLDFGEHPVDCARRELGEETGLRVERAEFIGFTNDLFGSERHYVTLWFDAHGVSGEPHVADPEEVAELAWFPGDALPTPLFEPLRQLLDGNLVSPMLWRPGARGVAADRRRLT